MSHCTNFNIIIILMLTASKFLYFQHTIHGHCLTNYMVNARTAMATFVTMSRNLSHCDRFYSRELTSSPLALLQRLVRHFSSYFL